MTESLIVFQFYYNFIMFILNNSIFTHYMYVMSPYILVRSDLGERGIVTDPKLASASSKQVRHEVVPPPPSKIGEVQREAESMTRLNYDDLLVIKSSFESEFLLP